MSLALVLPLSALLGLTLGLVGGGGAVLGIPLLVYLAGLSPESAIPMNLLIIALASLMGIWLGRRQRGLHRRAVFLIGGMGAIGAPLGASLTHRLTEPILLISMLSLMLLATLSIVVYCGSGYRSAIAASLLEASGFSQITNLMGGMHAWENHPCDGLNPDELVFATEA